MKKFIFFARVYSWLLVILPGPGSAQNLDVYPNYVVIGAFEHKKNAVFFTDDANKHNFPARFEMNSNRNLYYVYVLTTDDREHAFAEALKLRTDTKYFDTWVYSGSFGEAGLPNAKNQDLDFDPATGEKILSVKSDQGPTGDRSVRGNDNSTRKTRNSNDPVSKQENGNAGDATQTTPAGGITNSGVQSNETRNDNLTLPTSEKVGKKRGKNNSTKSGDQARLTAPGLAERKTSEQVTITRADGTSVVARTADGSREDKNYPAELSTDPTGQARNENTSTERINDSDASNDQSTIAGTRQRKEGIADADRIGADGLPLNPHKVGNRVVVGPTPKQVSTEPLSAEEVTGKNFYFYLFRADNNDMVGGEVDAIDFEKSRRMATYPANTQVKVIMPSGKSKQISFVCQVFGYRKLQKEFDPASPPEDMYLDDKGNVVVPFELMRLQKGDIAIMYNVFFFKDAAVMRPESRYEVNNLLELLQENPSYKIRIHGHTNGNAPGKIIYMDKPGNFYSLSNTRQGGGSAKKLSEERALVIREYLISSGISADRMQVEAWGGKKPIHDKNSARAHENVRVEIEILSE